jgi:aquaporin Z
MNKYIVEFFGTLFLVIVVLTTNDALPIGLALALAVILGGSISGGNFNPAVSISMFLNNKLSQKDLLLYILSQISGAVAALQLSKYIKH